MKSPVLGIVIVLALLATAVIFYVPTVFSPAPAAPLLQSYANDALGVAFTFPQGFILSENEIGTPDKHHYVISIIRESDAVPVVAGGEGPMSVIIDFYENKDGAMTLEDWLKTDESNLRLGDGATEAVTVDGTPAARYRWSGLYEGETTAFLHGNNIVAVSVAYQSTSDELYGLYEAILSSLSLH